MHPIRRPGVRSGLAARPPAHPPAKLVVPALLVPLFLLSALSPAAAESWFDFDRTGLAADWNQPSGNAKLSWEKVPAGESGPTGQSLRIQGPARGFVSTRQNRLPAGLAAQEAVVMRVRGYGGDTPVIVEIQFLEADGISKFWRKVEIGGGPWREVRLPLRYFRTAGTRLPQWERVRCFAFFLRTAADFSVDDIRLVSRPGVTAHLSVADLSETAFGDAPGVRRQSGTNGVVLTDCAELDLGVLTHRLQALAGELQAAFPFFQPPATPPALIVFAGEESYRDFPLRLASRLDSQAARAGSGGYTLMGIATSHWDPRKGAGRPVFYHEFVHAWLEKAGRFDCDGGWLQEGIANYYQLKLFPQADFSEIVRNGLTKENFRMPLRELCNGRRIPGNRYWQALTVVDWLFYHPPRNQKTRALLEAFQERNSTDLNGFLETVLESNWEALEQEWQTFCRQRYLPPPAAEAAQNRK